MPTPIVYVYSLSDLPSGKVDAARLAEEIEANDSDVLKQLGGLRVRVDDDLDGFQVEFKDTLSVAEKQALDGGGDPQSASVPAAGSLLYQHSGEPLPDTEGIPVTIVAVDVDGGSSIETRTEVTTTAVTTVEASDQRWDKNGSTINLGSGSFTTVWEKTQDNIAFFEAIFHLSSDRIDIQVEVDGVVIMDLDMDELKDDFKVSSSGSSSGNRGGARFSIVEYQSNRWRFQPLIPIRVGSSIKIQMRSQSGTKKCYRSIVTWGPR